MSRGLRDTRGRLKTKEKRRVIWKLWNDTEIRALYNGSSVGVRNRVYGDRG